MKIRQLSYKIVFPRWSAAWCDGCGGEFIRERMIKIYVRNGMPVVVCRRCYRAGNGPGPVSGLRQERAKMRADRRRADTDTKTKT